MNIDAFIREYGLFVTAICYVLYRELWPFVRDKLYPDHIKASIEDRRNSRRTEDRLFALAEQNVTVLTGLQKTLETISQQLPTLQHLPAITAALANLAIITTNISQDMAGLYGFLRAQQPSRAALPQERTVEQGGKQ